MTSEKNKTDEVASLAMYLKFGGYFAIIFGLINALSIFSQGYTAVRLGDTVINAVFGILFLVCARLLSGRKLLSMWIFAFTIVLSLVYTYVVGRGLNFFYAIFGAIVLYKFYKLKSDNRIA
ncbi:MAG: hypothetical protein JXA42_26200 [Anaerolineales bacterium]|nr:hypothetical protein [Anaerolineales bacterium]